MHHDVSPVIYWLPILKVAFQTRWASTDIGYSWEASYTEFIIDDFVRQSLVFPALLMIIMTRILIKECWSELRCSRSPTQVCEIRLNLKQFCDCSHQKGEAWWLWQRRLDELNLYSIVSTDMVRFLLLEPIQSALKRIHVTQTHVLN